MSSNPFADLGLCDTLVSSLAKLGFEEPTPIQTKAIPELIQGRDVLGQAATGTGKTAAFSLPLIQRYCLDQKPGKPKILILTPTRELCIQVSEAINSFGKDSNIVVLPVYGGQEYSRQIRALNRGVHIVVATPGRALDHIKRGTLDLSDIQAVVLDEADEMLDMGFADELDAIFEALPAERQTALFSATLPARISKIAENHLHDACHILIPKEQVPEGEQPKVKQTAYIVGKNHKTAALGRILDIESPKLAIVFARTRNEVDELAESLRGRGYSVEPLHGGLDQAQRDRVMKRARAEQVDVIVATDVAARGIDIDHLSHVINFGIPSSAETYIHRIGRTGRAGREGTAITILEPRESRLLKNIERSRNAKSAFCPYRPRPTYMLNVLTSPVLRCMSCSLEILILDAIVQSLKFLVTNSTLLMLPLPPLNLLTKLTGKMFLTSIFPMIFLGKRNAAAPIVEKASERIEEQNREFSLPEWSVCLSVPEEMQAFVLRTLSARSPMKPEFRQNLSEPLISLTDSPSLKSMKTLLRM